MKIVVHVGDEPLILLSENFSEEIDIDGLTKIDYTNLLGESVTISALLNKIGILRAEGEKQLSDAKLDCDIYEANIRKKWRNEASRNNGKFILDGEEIKLSEKALDEAVLLDVTYQKKKREIIEAQKDFNILDSWMWAITDKSKKLANLLKPVVPEEFMEELIEGKVNSFIIKKPKK